MVIDCNVPAQSGCCQGDTARTAKRVSKATIAIGWDTEKVNYVLSDSGLRPDAPQTHATTPLNLFRPVQQPTARVLHFKSPLQSAPVLRSSRAHESCFANLGFSDEIPYRSVSSEIEF